LFVLRKLEYARENHRSTRSAQDSRFAGNRIPGGRSLPRSRSGYLLRLGD
jgi:hypothetical protein